ncbi:MAG: Hsp20/alpha crystallin family protein [Cenarchaeum sp. SB0665_bin_23]|nr:Hsp20/alpha crystallin family protein [Cenarchaeum sp. SB0665_bin_23]
MSVYFILCHFYYINKMKMTIFEEFDRIFDSMVNNSSLMANPIWYGCRVVAGPDGPPAIQGFGNLQGNTVEVDVIPNEEKSEVKMVAEIPGVVKDEIQVSVDENVLVIDAIRSDKKYHASVPIQYPIVEDSVKASYKNGILEIVFSTESRPKGKQIRVE